MPSSLKQIRNDVPTVSLYVFLVIAGMLSLYSTSRPPEGYDWNIPELLASDVGKQFVWLILSAGAWFVVNHFIRRDFWVRGAYPIYAGTVVLLLLVLVAGKEINNARSWFSLFGFTFQPSELAKLGAALAMAAYLSQWTGKLRSVGPVVSALAIMAVPAGLIVLQPDPGSALVFFSFVLVLYREGLAPQLVVFGLFTVAALLLGILQPTPVLVGGLMCLLIFVLALSVPRRLRWWLAGAVAVAAAAATGLYLDLGWPVLAGVTLAFVASAAYHTLRRNFALVATTLAFLVWGSAVAFVADFTFYNVFRQHQQDRIDAWLRPERLDEQGPLYNIIQSKLAIAAGGLQGRGFGEGTITKYDYVPEQETDFIFSAVGEAQGFVGSAMVILAFLGLLWRISVIAERQNRTFGRAYAYGIAGILLIHMLVNIGMTMGVMPVIGIPLPFVSKGGSSLLSFTIMIAVLVKIDRHRADV